MGLLTWTQHARRPRADKMQQGHIRPSGGADLCPVLGRFGGVSSDGAAAVLVTGSLPHSQPRNNSRGPAFRNSLKKKIWLGFS